MSNFNIKLNLLGFKHSVRSMKGANGMIDCIVIPLAANHLFKGEKGIYVDITAIEVKNPKFDDTHILKQGLPKEVYEAMTDEEKAATPIFGNMGPWQSKGQPAMVEQPEDDDLPF